MSPVLPGIRGVIPAGTKSDKIFNGTDLFPTICKLTDIPISDTIHYDGIANFDAFLNKEVKGKVPRIWFYPNHPDTYFRMPQVEMRSGHYSIVGWLPPKPDSVKLNDWFFNNGPVRYELYDLSNDPGQQHDLAGEKSGMVDSLAGPMDHLWVEMRDEGKALKN